MADDLKPREHYIPIRLAELVEMLAADRSLSTGEPLSPEDADGFQRFCRIISAVFHFEFHYRLDAIKEDYAPFDPDADTISLKPPSADARTALEARLYDQLSGLLQKANYSRLSDQQILDATESATAWGVNLDVDLKAFSHIEVWTRGNIVGKRTLRTLANWYRKTEINLPIYQRVVLVLRQTDDKRFGPTPDTKDIFLKMFKDIPRADLEMVIPGSKLKMAWLDQTKLGGSLVSALGFVGWKIYTGLGAILSSVSGGIMGLVLGLYGPLALILGYGYKQYAGYQQTKTAYTLKLTQSLYYQTLDSNEGVLFRLLAEAEEQECREAILAYFYLWRYASDQPDGWDADGLDKYAEMDLARRANVEVDFEIEDALEKLVRLKLVEQVGDKYKAVPLTRALETLDRMWDNYFQYNRE